MRSVEGNDCDMRLVESSQDNGCDRNSLLALLPMVVEFESSADRHSSLINRKGNEGMYEGKTGEECGINNRNRASMLANG